MGQRDGVCRDFAVLGYCERGLECPQQHVRECPDFAEKGTCETKGCKLPHVIRANRNRKAGGGGTNSTTEVAAEKMDVTGTATAARDVPMLTAEDGQLGDDFISLTFRESDSDGDADDTDDDDEDESEGDDDAESDGEIEVHM